MAVGAGNQVYVGSLGGGTVPGSVTVVDRATTQVLGHFTVAGPVRGLAVNSDSGLEFLAGDRGQSTVDATQLRIVREADAGVLFSVATGTGPSRDLFVGDAIDGEVTRLSYRSGERR